MLAERRRRLSLSVRRRCCSTILLCLSPPMKKGEVKQNNNCRMSYYLGSSQERGKKDVHTLGDSLMHATCSLCFPLPRSYGGDEQDWQGGGEKHKNETPSATRNTTVQGNAINLRREATHCSQTINSRHLSSLSVSFASSPPRFGPRLFRIVTPAWLLTHAAN